MVTCHSSNRKQICPFQPGWIHATGSGRPERCSHGLGWEPLAEGSYKGRGTSCLVHRLSSRLCWPSSAICTLFISTLVLRTAVEQDACTSRGLRGSINCKQSRVPKNLYRVSHPSQEGWKHLKTVQLVLLRSPRKGEETWQSLPTGVGCPSPIPRFSGAGNTRAVLTPTPSPRVGIAWLHSLPGLFLHWTSLRPFSFSHPFPALPSSPPLLSNLLRPTEWQALCWSDTYHLFFLISLGKFRNI